MMELNVDAALSKNSIAVALAAAARDGIGNFLGASALVVEGVSSPEVAEAMACREGLALASDLGLPKIRIATECANVVKNIYGLEWVFTATLLGRSRPGWQTSRPQSSSMKAGTPMVILID
jgi:ribonuclease HI